MGQLILWFVKWGVIAVVLIIGYVLLFTPDPAPPLEVPPPEYYDVTASEIESSGPAAMAAFTVARSLADHVDYAADQPIYADSKLRALAAVKIAAGVGGKFHVQARLEAHDATARMLAEIRLRCTTDSPGDLWTTQNLTAGQDVGVLHARFLFTAPLDGSYTCELLTRSLIPGGSTNLGASYQVEGDGTYLRVDPAAAWAQGELQPTEALVTRTRAWDVTVMDFIAPDAIERFTATADVEVTNCYGPSKGCETEPVNRDRSLVGSRLLVMQRAAGGGYCAVTSWPASGLDNHNVSWAVHHKKNYHRAAVAVSTAPGCLRSFRIKTYVRWLAGNDMLVERAPYSNVYVH
jgi:hypothetical protein